jgi:hypothetical protein
MPDAGACGGSLGVIELLAEFNTAPTLNGSVPVIATALQSTIAFLSVTAGPATRIAWPLIGGVVAVGIWSRGGLAHGPRRHGGHGRTFSAP